MIPDEPTDENVKRLLERLVLCGWPERETDGTRFMRTGIRWDDLFDYSSLSVHNVVPIPIL
jgi:hypothetical protein